VNSTSPITTSHPSSVIGLTYCERIERSTGIALIISGLLGVLAVLSGVVIYTRILLHLRPVDAFLPPPSTTSASASNMGGGGITSSRHSTRGVLTGVALMVGYALTWLPYLVVKYISLELSMDDYEELSMDGQVSCLQWACSIN